MLGPLVDLLRTPARQTVEFGDGGIRSTRGDRRAPFRKLRRHHALMRHLCPRNADVARKRFTGDDSGVISHRKMAGRGGSIPRSVPLPTTYARAGCERHIVFQRGIGFPMARTAAATNFRRAPDQAAVGGMGCLKQARSVAAADVDDRADATPDHSLGAHAVGPAVDLAFPGLWRR